MFSAELRQLAGAIKIQLKRSSHMTTALAGGFFLEQSKIKPGI